MTQMLTRRRFLLGGAETAVPKLGQGCLNARGVACRICADSCDAEAIRVTPELEGRASLAISAELCTGCGLCADICPAFALSLRDERAGDV